MNKERFVMRDGRPIRFDHLGREYEAWERVQPNPFYEPPTEPQDLSDLDERVEQATRRLKEAAERRVNLPPAIRVGSRTVF